MPAFHPVEFVPPAVDCESRADGTLILRSPQGLAKHSNSVLAWLRHWADVRPE
jgi:hypothetical protein